MSQINSYEEMINIFEEKNGLKEKKKKKLIVESEKTTNSPQSDAGKGEITDTTDEIKGKYHNQNIKRAKERNTKTNFTLRKKNFETFY